MVTSSEPLIRCPKCQAPLGTKSLADGAPVVCGRCGNKFRPQSPHELPVDDCHPATAERGLLEWLEDLLIKMIRGIFQFILVKLPCEFYRAICRWFPTLVRLIRVTVLGIAWACLALGPTAASMAHERIVTTATVRGWFLPSWYVAQGDAWQFGSYVYTALALAGSCWGALYIKRRRRRLSKN